MRELIDYLLDLWVTVPDHFNMNWYLMFMMIILRLWVDGLVSKHVTKSYWESIVNP